MITTGVAIASLQGNLETLAYIFETWNVKTTGEVLGKERKFWLDVRIHKYSIPFTQ
jgi:hypothetical protein